MNTKTEGLIDKATKHLEDYVGTMGKVVEAVQEETVAFMKEVAYYEQIAVQYELEKAFDTIEDMDKVIKERDKEILSLQDQVQRLEIALDLTYIMCGMKR